MTAPITAASASSHDEQLALVVSELTYRVQRGEAVDLEVECRKHPQFASDLRELWGVIVVARVASFLSSANSLQTGDVIHSVNQTPIDSLSSLRTALRQIKPR